MLAELSGQKFHQIRVGLDIFLLLSEIGPKFHGQHAENFFSRIFEERINKFS